MTLHGEKWSRGGSLNRCPVPLAIRVLCPGGRAAIALGIGVASQCLAPGFARARTPDTPAVAAQPSSLSTAEQERNPPTAEQLRIERVVRLNEEGNRLYSSRQFRKALERFLQAHAIDEDPNLLFNIGNCYEKMGQVDGAIEKYREFLAAEGIYPEGRARAEQSLQALLSRNNGSVNSPPAQPPPRVGSPRAAEPSSSLGTFQPASGTQWTDDLQRDEVWLKRQLPWVTLGLGGVLSAAGATMLTVGLLNHSQVNSARSTELLGSGEVVVVSSITRARAMSLIGAGNRNKLLGGVGLAAGLALLATYAGVDWADGDESLAVSADGANSGITVRGRF